MILTLMVEMLSSLLFLFNFIILYTLWFSRTLMYCIQNIKEFKYQLKNDTF